MAKTDPRAKRIALFSIAAMALIAGYMWFRNQAELDRIAEDGGSVLGEIICLNRHPRFAKVCYEYRVGETIYLAYRLGRIPDNVSVGDLGTVRLAVDDPEISRFSFDVDPWLLFVRDDLSEELSDPLHHVGKCTCKGD